MFLVNMCIIAVMMLLWRLRYKKYVPMASPFIKRVTIVQYQKR